MTQSYCVKCDGYHNWKISCEVLQTIKLGSVSYPYIAVAKHYGINYGEVLKFIESDDSVATNWQIDALKALQEEMHRRKNVK